MKKENKILKFGVPNQPLKEFTEELFRRASYDFIIDERSSAVHVDDPEIECFFSKEREIASLIKQEILDAGLVSKAILEETKNTKLREICNLGTLKIIAKESEVVLAVPKNSRIKSIKDINGKKIITRVPEVTREFLRKNKISAIIEFSEGTNEAKVPTFADAVVEFAYTGETLKRNNLEIIAVLMKNSVILAANETMFKDKWKKEKIENLAILLKGARLAQEMAGLTLHASNDMLEEVFKVLPSLKKPTITHLRGENWFDVLTVANKKEIRKIIPKLKKIGCTDIVEFPLNKVII